MMNNFERFPRLARALVAAGVPAGAHQDLLAAALADARNPPVHGTGPGAPTVGMSGFEEDVAEAAVTGDPETQKSWAVAFRRDDAR